MATVHNTARRPRGTSLPQPLVRYWKLGLVLLVGTLLRATPASPGTDAVSDVLRARRMEVVSDTGQVVWRVEAHPAGGVLQLWNAQGQLGLTLETTATGGRLVVRNAAQQEVFNIGMPSPSAFPSHWESAVRLLDEQQQVVTQQAQALVQLERRLRRLEDLTRAGTSLERPLQGVEEVRRDLDQYRRELDQQRRLLDMLAQQLQRLERR